MELEAQVRSHENVGQLLVRQDDVEPDRFLADIVRASIGGFHNRRATARANNVVALAVGVSGEIAGHLRKLTRDIIIFGFGLEPLRHAALAIVMRRRDHRFGLGRLRDPRRSVEHEGRGDVGLVHQQFGLEQFKLEANRAEVLAKQELGVLERELIRLALGLRRGRDMLGSLRVDLGGRENALGGAIIGHKRCGLKDS